MELGFKTLWSTDDGEYVGLCNAYPSLSFLSSDRTKAMQGIIKLVLDVLGDDG